MVGLAPGRLDALQETALSESETDFSLAEARGQALWGANTSCTLPDHQA
jgi:hypothetical protein